MALAGTVLGYFGRWHWFLDLFAHFRGQYLVALAGSGLLLLVARRPWTAAAFLIGAGLNARALAPLFGPPPTAPAMAAQPTVTPPLRIVTCNVLYINNQQTQMLDWLRSSPGDVVFLCEVTRGWADALRSLVDVYPHQHFCPRSDPFGCAVLSTRPWTQLEEKQWGTFVSPSLVVQFPWGDREVLMLGMHPTPPNGSRGSGYRNRALESAAAFLTSHPVRSQLLVGDLNATPWCHALRSLVERTGLSDSARGHGWQPTWNVESLLFQIPIDHVLVSPDLVTTGRRLGPDLGSDHRAVMVELQLASDQ